MCRGFKSRLRHVFFFFGFKSRLRHVFFFFFFFFIFFIYFFLCFFLSLLLQCKFANSTLLSLLSFSNFITPYDAQASSAFSALIFTVVSVFTKENFNPFSNLISPFGIGTHEIQWLFSIFLTHNWSPIYLLL